MNYISTTTERTFRQMLTLLSGETHVMAFDLETTGLDPYEPGASVVSISITLADEDTFVVPINHRDSPWGYEWAERLRSIASALKGKKVMAHNAGFDIRWVRVHTGVDLSDELMMDTQTAAHLLNENQSKKLKSLAAHLVGGDWGIDVRDTYNEEWFKLAEYNAIDTIATMRLAMSIGKQMVGTPLLDHLTLLTAAQRALMDMQHRGIRLDRDAALAALDAAQAERRKAQMWLEVQAAEYGMLSEGYTKVSWEPTSKWFLAFMGYASAEGDVVIDEYTTKGRPSWRAGVLEKQARNGSEVARQLLSYRHGAKQAQFIISWLDAASYDGRIHANFNIARTSTGRLSSSDPNMQQVSRELKPLFAATEGSQFCEVDYSQVELRVAAELVHRSVLPNNPMMQAYLDGADLHSLAATLAVGGKPENVSKEDRQRGKAINFGFIFGMGINAFVKYAEETYGVVFTRTEATNIQRDYFSLWEGMGEWHEYQRQFARDNGYVETLYGRMRRLPDIYSSDQYLMSVAERQSINSPVQGTAADMMLDSLAQLHTSELTGYRLVGTVHDSALLEIDSEDAAHAVCDIMLSPSVEFHLPIEVEASIGPRWGTYNNVFTRRTP